MITLPSGLTVLRRSGWTPESCPKREEHDPFPADFWAGPPPRPVSKTHRQAIHAVCGLWTLWVPFRAGPDPREATEGSSDANH